MFRFDFTTCHPKAVVLAHHFWFFCSLVLNGVEEENVAPRAHRAMAVSWGGRWFCLVILWPSMATFKNHGCAWVGWLFACPALSPDLRRLLQIFIMAPDQTAVREQRHSIPKAFWCVNWSIQYYQISGTKNCPPIVCEMLSILDPKSRTF